MPFSLLSHIYTRQAAQGFRKPGPDPEAGERPERENRPNTPPHPPGRGDCGLSLSGRVRRKRSPLASAHSKKVVSACDDSSKLDTRRSPPSDLACYSCYIAATSATPYFSVKMYECTRISSAYHSAGLRPFLRLGASAIESLSVHSWLQLMGKQSIAPSFVLHCVSTHVF